jgi:hypothetical protein
MAKWNSWAYTVQLEAENYVQIPTFITTHTYWLEYCVNYLSTYLERLQTEILADATIGAYTTTCPIVADDDLGRLDVNAYLEDQQRMFIIHSPTLQDNPEQVGGAGRVDVLLEATVTSVANKPGYDSTGHREKVLTGDGNPTTSPGVIEMQEHLETMLHNSGQMNLLESGGVPYIWFIEWEAPELDEELQKLKSGVLAYRRRVRGHKWRYNW